MIVFILLWLHHLLYVKLNIGRISKRLRMIQHCQEISVASMCIPIVFTLLIDVQVHFIALAFRV